MMFAESVAATSSSVLSILLDPVFRCQVSGVRCQKTTFTLRPEISFEPILSHRIQRLWAGPRERKLTPETLDSTIDPQPLIRGHAL